MNKFQSYSIYQAWTLLGTHSFHTETLSRDALVIATCFSYYSRVQPIQIDLIHPGNVKQIPNKTVHWTFIMQVKIFCCLFSWLPF